MVTMIYPVDYTADEPLEIWLKQRGFPNPDFNVVMSYQSHTTCTTYPKRRQQHLCDQRLIRLDWSPPRFITEKGTYFVRLEKPVPVSQV